MERRRMERRRMERRIEGRRRGARAVRAVARETNSKKGGVYL